MAKKIKNKNIAKTVVHDGDAYDRPLLAWEAPQYEQNVRGRLWLTLACCIAAIVAAAALYAGVWTLALIAILAPIVLWMESRKKAPQVAVVFSSYGIKFGIFKLPYSSIPAFWIHHHPPRLDRLTILTNNRLHPELHIPLCGQDPAQIRNFLSSRIPEWEGKPLPLLDLTLGLFKLK